MKKTNCWNMFVSGKNSYPDPSAGDGSRRRCRCSRRPGTSRAGRAVWFFFLIGLLACSRPAETDRIVTVSIEPLRYFAEAIGGDRFTVKSLVGAGLNPENYDPTPRQMVELGKSEAYFQVGALGFERAWMDRIRENNPHLRIFDMSQGFAVAPEPEVHGHAADESDAQEEPAGHDHGGVDPHIWSSVSGARQIASNLLEAFIALDPENESAYKENYRALLEEIGRTEQVVRHDLDSLRHRTFIIYHPALTYFAREFGLTQLCIEFDGKEPTPAQLKELIETARTNGVEVVFVQEEFDRKNAELIAAETGCALVPINPLSYDWNGEMRRIAHALAYGKTD